MQFFPIFLFGVETLIVIYISHNAETNSFFENKIVKNVVTLKYNKVVDWQQTIVTFLTIILKLHTVRHKRVGGKHQWLVFTSYSIVRSAWALSNGCKSRVSPNSGNRIAQGKGVHREVGSEGSRRQTSGLTNRNFIQGIWPWVRLLCKPKPDSYSERLV